MGPGYGETPLFFCPPYISPREGNSADASTNIDNVADSSPHLTTLCTGYPMTPDASIDSASTHYSALRPRYPASFLDELCRRADRHPGSPVLDLATGPGTIAIELGKRGLDVIAVDPNREMLKQGEINARKAGVQPRILWRTGDVDHLPSEAVDIALTTIGDDFRRMPRGTVLRHLHKITRPGGSVALLTHRWEGYAQPPWQEVVEAVRVRHLGPRVHDEPTGEFTHVEPQGHEEIFLASPFHVTSHTTAHYPVRTTVDALITWQLNQVADSALGARRDVWEADLRRSLTELAPSGQFDAVSYAHLFIGQREFAPVFAPQMPCVGDAPKPPAADPDEA